MTPVMSGSPLSVDVLIIGAGPAGSMLALGCAKQGIRVAVLARNPREHSKPPIETLPPRGEFLLKSLGILSDCLEGATRSDDMLVSWQTPSLMRNRIALDPHGSNWHIDRSSFDKSLVSAALALDINYIVVQGSSRLAIDRTRLGWSIQTGPSGMNLSVRSSLVVDASGLARVVARSRGSTVKRDDVLAIVWTVVKDCESHSALLIEAVPDGWWYSLGQPNGTLLCALVVDARHQAKAGETRTGLWRRAWGHSRHSRDRVPYTPAQLSVSVAESGRLTELHGEGWFAVGDAATSFDPLSSNGLCNAIEQSIALSQVIAAGDPSSMERSRYAEAVIEKFELYRAQRDRMYRCVTRFAHHDFWLSRALSGTTAARGTQQ